MANLATSTHATHVDSFLSKLQNVIKKGGMEYHQIVAVSESIAKAMFVLCELLVARGLTAKIVLPCLPIGYTHEDISAISAKL